MSKKSVLKWFLLIVLLATIYYFNPDIFKQILRIKYINVNTILILSFLCITNQVLLGIEIKILCKAFDVHLSIVECFGLSSVRSIANYLPFGAGIISNAIYLKKQKQLSVANYSSSLSVSIILMFLVAGFIGLLTCIFLKITSNSVRADLIILFISVFTGSMIMMFVKIPDVKSTNYVTNFLGNFQNGYALLKDDKNTIKKLIFLKSFLLILLVIKMKIIFASIGYTVSFGTVVLIVMSVVAFRIATILPGNIGLTESISGFAANSSGSTFEHGFVGMATDRIIQTTWIFIFGIIFLIYFNSKLKFQE